MAYPSPLFFLKAIENLYELKNSVLFVTLNSILLLISLPKSTFLYLFNSYMNFSLKWSSFLSWLITAPQNYSLFGPFNTLFLIFLKSSFFKSPKYSNKVAFKKYLSK